MRIKTTGQVPWSIAFSFPFLLIFLFCGVHIYFDALKNKKFLIGLVKYSIEEETAPFFAGDRTAEDTARIIQNRVQTYLSEQR